MKNKTVCSLLILTVMILSGAVQAGEMNPGYVNSYLCNNIRDMEISGNHLYCAYVNGLKILDLSKPSRHRTIRQSATSHSYWFFWISQILMI